MNPVEQLVLSKIKLPTKVRKQIEPGHYKGEITTTTSYDLTVGENYMSPVNPAWMKLCIVAFSKMNVKTQDAIIRRVVDDGADIADLVKAIEPSVKKRVRALMPERECNGKVTGKTFILGCETISRDW